MGTTVGHSERTPAKHALLNKTLGPEIGAARFCARDLRVAYSRHVFADLTAGDGTAYYEGDWRIACSPGIFAHHGRFDQCKVPVEILLCERDVATFEKLVAALQEHLPTLGYRQIGELRWSACTGRVVLDARHGDSRGLACPWGRGTFVFLSNDPNNMHGWALPDDLNTAVDRGAIVRSFSTMGANAEGIKRLPREGARDGWYGHIERVTSNLRSTQDAVLIAIDRDAAQWAYQVVTPVRWADKDIESARKLFGALGLAVTTASFRREPDQYGELLDRLFLTSNERRATTDPQLFQS